MTIRHKFRSPLDDEGMPEGAVKPSNWNDEHEADGLIGALLTLGVQPGAMPYLDDNGAGGMAPVSAFVRDTLLSVISAAALRALMGAASIDSPGFIASPTAPTPSAGDNSTRLATTAYADRAVATVVGAAPDALNALNEIAAALNNDPNFATTIINALALKAPLNSPAFTGAPIAPTQAAGDNSTKLATTAYADAAVAVLSAAITTLLAAKAPLASPALTGSPTAPTPTAGDNTQKIATTQFVGTALASIGASNINPNRLINGGFQVFQRGAGSYASGAYCIDGAYVLTESGSVAVAQVVDPSGETGSTHAVQLTQPDATAKRIGLAMPIESVDIRDLRAAAVAISARARLSAGGNIRWALLETTATADAFTKAIVNNWASTTYTPGNFFTAAVSVIASGVVAPGAGVWGGFSGNGTFGGAVNNAILFVWSESQQAQSATLSLNRCKVEGGANPTAFLFQPASQVLARCQRWLEIQTVRYAAVESMWNAARVYQCTFGHRVTKRVAVNPTLSAITLTRCSSPTLSAVTAENFTLATQNSNANGDDFTYVATATTDAAIGV